MSHTRMLASKKATPDSPDIMTVDEAASILTHMNLADRLLNPTNRLEICGKPSLSSNDHTQPIEEKLSPQNLHRIENAWKLGNQGLHPNRPRLLPKYRAPSAKYKPLAWDFFAMNMDVDTTASAKGKAPGQIPKNDHMDAESTTQTPNQANSRARKTVSQRWRGLNQSKSGRSRQGRRSSQIPMATLHLLRRIRPSNRKLPYGSMQKLPYCRPCPQELPPCTMQILQ